MLVAQGFFETLGVQPSVGRLFQPEEFIHHRYSQLRLFKTHPFWKRQFGGERSDHRTDEQFTELIRMI